MMFFALSKRVDVGVLSASLLGAACVFFSGAVPLEIA